MIDRLAVAASVFIRMGAGLLVFVLMARGLGPQDYGLVATVFACASLASLLTDFGFASKTLRDIAADRENGGAVLNASLAVKLYLTVAVGLIGAIALALAPGAMETRLAAGLLGAAVLIAAIGDLALTAYRAVGRYRAETWLTIWTSAIHLALVGWVALVSRDLLLLAIVFVVSRVAYTVAAVVGAERLFVGHRLKLPPLRQVWLSIKQAWGWATDSGLGYLTGQADALLVPTFFGLHAAGIYQAGARFIQAGLNIVSILAAVHIPRLARGGAAGGTLTRDEKRMMLEFAAAGVFLGLGFVIAGPWITKLLLGDGYGPVNVLWLGFAVFLVLRYMAASFGAALSARGMPLTRVAGQIVALLVIVVGFVFTAPTLGLAAVPWIMSASAGATLIAYALARFRMARLAPEPVTRDPSDNLPETSKL